MLQGLTGYCSMPGMAAVAVAWRNQPSGVPPGGVNSIPGYNCSCWVLRAGRGGGRGGDQEGGRRAVVVTSPLAGSDLVELLGLC